MLDLARNYYSMGFLKNVIQLMGMKWVCPLWVTVARDVEV